jgi:hypothetical protein
MGALFAQLLLLSAGLAAVILLVVGNFLSQVLPDPDSGASSPSPARTTSPRPSATSAATGSASPQATPSVAPSTALAFAPIEDAGVGDDVITFTPPNVRLAIVTVTHDGERLFSIQSIDSQGEQLDLLVGVIGAYSGTTLLDMEDQPVGFEVSADGAWTGCARRAAHR